MALTLTSGTSWTNGLQMTSARLNASVNSASYTGTLEVAHGGTGVTTKAEIQSFLDLGSLAYQSAGAVSVSGGTITGTSVTLPLIRTANSGTPSITIGPGAGSGSVSISGNDIRGTFTITHGSGATVPNVAATISFSSAYSSAPTVLLTPASEKGAGNVGVYSVTASTTSFVVSAWLLPQVGAVNSYNYLVVQ